MATDDATSELVPLHKLSQWLAYSLIEPLQRAGFTVTDIDGLTGLAEYRNGGLFVDGGVLVLRDLADAARAHEVGDPLVVEWRALTVALLDRLALAVRARLNRGAADAAACQNPARRHLGGRPRARVCAPRRRRSADQSHQRRHGVLNAKIRAGENNHARRQDRRSSAGAAQADADPRQEPLDQIVSRAAQGNRHAAVLRGHARPAADDRRDRDAARQNDGAAPRRQETGVRADPARRPHLRRRHARSGAGCARRPYRALSRAGDVRRGRIFLQGADRSGRASGRSWSRRCWRPAIPRLPPSIA